MLSFRRTGLPTMILSIALLAAGAAPAQALGHRNHGCHGGGCGGSYYGGCCGGGCYGGWSGGCCGGGYYGGSGSRVGYYGSPYTGGYYQQGYVGGADGRTAYSYSPDGNTARGAVAVVQMRVPADAEVWFDDYQTKQSGENRTFETPALNSDGPSTYNLRIRYKEGGEQKEQTKRIEVRPGQRMDVNFLKPENLPKPGSGSK